jgi:cell wall assembly regulator SMI1
MKLDDTGPPLTEIALAKLEEQLELKLPQDFRAFLLESNGGYLEEGLTVDFVETGYETVTSTLINEFYYLGSSTDRSFSNIASEHVRLIENDLIPPSLIPVATDAGGNYILLCVSGDDYGHVYFANHELEDPETGYLVMSSIADSFTEFIDMLYSEE